MKEEFVIQRHGRDFVLYQGLLDEAYRCGLKSIDTEVLQIPTEESGQVAICKAVATTEEGQSFSGIGDASPDSVGKGIVPHLLRMSETRAKARALRDLCNIGATSLEELGEDNAEDKAAPDNGSSTKPVRSLDRTASEETVEALQKAIEGSGHSIDKFEERYGPTYEVSEGFARKWLSKLNEESD